MRKTLTVCNKCDSLNNVDIEKSNSQKPVCGQCHSILKMYGAVSEVNEKNFWRILKKADKPVVVDFWASWCGPCKVYGPTFEEASTKTDKAIFLKVSTEQSPELSQKLNILGIPATVVFKEGVEVTRQSGALSLESLLNLANTSY